MSREVDVAVGGRWLRVREAGDPDGFAVVFFHGLGDSRLDLCLGEPMAATCHVRLVSFDRPGYGASTAAPFGLASVPWDVDAVADHLRIERFAALGQSAGSPFALATAAALGDRVTAVGCASGGGPVGQVLGSLDDFDDDDRAAYALLPDDPAGAAKVLAASFDPVVKVARDGDDAALVAAFAPMLAPADLVLLADHSTRASAIANARESLRQGADGAGWDAVAGISPWDFDLNDVDCPVFLWYGDQDTTPLVNAFWLRDHLPDARLVVWPGEGHLAYKRHLHEMFDALVSTPQPPASR